MDLRDTFLKDLQSLSKRLEDSLPSAESVALYTLLAGHLRELESRPAESALTAINSRLTKVEHQITRLAGADTIAKTWRDA